MKIDPFTKFVYLKCKTSDQTFYADVYKFGGKFRVFSCDTCHENLGCRPIVVFNLVSVLLS